TRRNIHGQRPLAHDAARAGAGRARIVDDLAAPLAGRAGALDREEALGGTNLAEAGTRRAARWLGAGLCSRTGAFLAGDTGRHADLSRLAGVGLREGNLEIVPEVGTALAP